MPFHKIIKERFFTIIHRRTPIIVGNNIATITHFQLPVSFLIVKQVVEQGK